MRKRTDAKLYEIQTEGTSQEEEAFLIQKLWNLFQTIGIRTLGCDSTSMSMDRAEQLMESLLYTLSVVIEEGTTKEELLSGNLEHYIHLGRKLLSAKLAEAKLNWKLLCQDVPPFYNVYFIDTIQNIGDFFQKYELYEKAHDIPCSIDYWLLCPVPEEKKGISFISDYLFRLQIENDLINSFDRNEVKALYDSATANLKEDFFNLCDPVLVNAIGLMRVKPDIELGNTLSVSEEQKQELLRSMSSSEDKVREIVQKAVMELCERTGLTQEYEKIYFLQASENLIPRLMEAIKRKDLSAVFITYQTPKIIQIP